MNEHKLKELRILIESIGWREFKAWMEEFYKHSLEAELSTMELTDIGSILKERELIGACKYLKQATNHFENYINNISQK